MLIATAFQSDANDRPIKTRVNAPRFIYGLHS